MSIRNYDKKVFLIITDSLSGHFKKIELVNDYSPYTIMSIIEDLCSNNIKDLTGFRIDFSFEQ